MCSCSHGATLDHATMNLSIPGQSSMQMSTLVNTSQQERQAGPIQVEEISHNDPTIRLGISLLYLASDSRGIQFP